MGGAKGRFPSYTMTVKMGSFSIICDDGQNDDVGLFPLLGAMEWPSKRPSHHLHAILGRDDKYSFL